MVDAIIVWLLLVNLAGNLWMVFWGLTIWVDEPRLGAAAPVYDVVFIMVEYILFEVLI